METLNGLSRGRVSVNKTEMNKRMKNRTAMPRKVACISASDRREKSWRGLSLHQTVGNTTLVRPNRATARELDQPRGETKPFRVLESSCILFPRGKSSAQWIKAFQRGWGGLNYIRKTKMKGTAVLLVLEEEGHITNHKHLGRVLFYCRKDEHLGTPMKYKAKHGQTKKWEKLPETENPLCAFQPFPL